MSKKHIKWLKAAGIRAIKTMAQTAAALVPVAIRFDEVDWFVVLSTALTAGIMSIVTSLAGLPEVELR